MMLIENKRKAEACASAPITYTLQHNIHEGYQKESTPCTPTKTASLFSLS